MEDVSERFERAISELEEVADRVTPHDAHRELDETTLQVFWRKWPDVSGWAATLWRLLNEELSEPAVPATESEDHDVGGGG